MAKSKSTSRKTSKSKNSTPAVRHLRYELTNSSNAGTETSHYIDLARDISAINRRLYRQGRAYHVRKVTIISSNTPNAANRISISTVPDSWTARGAWKRGFAYWNEHHKDAMRMGETKRGRFADYKVHLSDAGRTGTQLVPKDNGGNLLQLGEWNYSTMVTPDGTTTTDSFDLHMLGAHNGAAGSRVSVGLVQSYGETRTTINNQVPNVPGTASDDPLANIFDSGTQHDEVIDNIEGENDNCPYDITNYPGMSGNMAKPLVVADTTLMDGKATVGGFVALCGLLEIEATSPIGSDVFSVLVELAPGNYRGVSADVI